MLRHNLRDSCEAFLLAALFYSFRVLPIGVASGFGGLIGRAIGPLLPVTRRARRNLDLVYPAMTRPERAAIVRDMWDNLGRMAAEIPHLRKISTPCESHVEFVGSEYVLNRAASGQPTILVGAHIANWELMSVFLSNAGIDLTSIAREMNNDLSQRVIEHYRNMCGGLRIGKGNQGARQAIATLRRGATLGILIDQKFNEGIPVPFLGHEAMTAATPALLALRFGCPIVPVRIERLHNTTFRITCLPPIEPEITADREGDIRALTAQLNGILGGWIRERPAQWFWVHKRWPNTAYRSAQRL